MQNPLAYQKPFSKLNQILSVQTLMDVLKKKPSQYVANRLISHFVLAALIISAAILGGIRLSQTQLKAIVPASTSSREESTSIINVSDTVPKLSLSGQLRNNNQGLLLAAPVPFTTVPDRTDHSPKIITYVVQPGDTIFGIALAHNIQPETLQWSNPKLERNPDLLMVGDEITILPVDGVYHQVATGETLDEIADTLSVTIDDIINYPLNKLNPENPVITDGQWLIVPNGVKPYVQRYVSAAQVKTPDGAQKGVGIFQWPTTGSITQDYWWGHRALDIGGWIGAPIYAADSGYVVIAQWDNSGYGNLIKIDHGNGFATLYAHLSEFDVSAGDEVTGGQLIGKMGSTGRSTGPHLHFEIRLNGVLRNPWGFLP